MRSYITYSGYGYRKRVCEDVTVWFLSKFLPRHKLDIDIIHRGLKKDSVYGYCDFTDDHKRPRSFLIELDTHMEQEIYIKTLFHELTHVKQWVDGKLRLRYGKMSYCKEPVEFYEYWYQPHEIEARRMENILYSQYILEKQGPVSQVAHYFPNRLCSPL